MVSPARGLWSWVRARLQPRAVASPHRRRPRLVPARLLAGTRLLLVVCSLSLLSLLLLGRCNLDLQQEAALPDPSTGSSASQQQQQQLSLQEETRAEVERLTAQIRDLRRRLLALTGNAAPAAATPSNSSGRPTAASPRSAEAVLGLQTLPAAPADGLSGEECARHVRQRLAAAELLDRGRPLASEFELVAFSHFTLSRVYPVELALGKRVVEKPIGFRRRDLLEALNKALETLNSSSSGAGRHYSLEDFSEGVYRTEPTTGTQYELYFRAGRPGAARVSLARPFAPLQALAVEPVPAAGRDKPLVHVLLPLAGRTAAFRAFIDKFVRIALRNDRRVQLTVVYFGEEGLAEARAAMSRALSLSLAARSPSASASGGTGAPPPPPHRRPQHGEEPLRLLALNESFSRGRGLRVAAERAAPGRRDALLFMCDVDVVFSARFLDRCRWNARPGKKVYYPIVFSLYNPHVVYTLQGRPLPPEAEQLVISRDTGFWRDFGFGMTCQYRSDFLKVGGFSEDVVGWGGEDVSLYRKYVRSSLKVVRATDPGIFHLWHPKECGRRLPTDQYRACLRSRALSEASHAQLGFLAFRDELTPALGGVGNVSSGNHNGQPARRA
ncbi:chondroitin sulfate N-acetylgalactosaminyltransferase 1 [Schistocerca gregaria]|uniref:chondroitin sulfate N-acetylgalactosaminyltransferase 1 n=1 Tax=Schistocerca gregaria TaxID=7010 RepID=UPI00211E5350|nr:chondroitin sulfate N-acetylgalactosaminyltransferase 1 [Schistocerca gregaria]